MSQNQNMAPSSGIQSVGNPALKQLPSIGTQSFGSMPNVLSNMAQPTRPPNQYPGPGPGNTYNNPNGLTNSPGTTPSPYASSPALRPALQTGVYNNNSSLHSSRNNSPAMNHSGVSHSPIPPSQYPPQNNVLRPSFTQPSAVALNVTPGLASQSFPRQPGPIFPPSSVNSQLTNFPRPSTSNINPSVPPQNNMLTSQPPNLLQRPPTDVPSTLPPTNASNVYPPQGYNQTSFSQPPVSTQNFPPRVTPNSIPNSYPAYSQPGQTNLMSRPPLTGSVAVSGPSSLPFPSRQINSNMPPLVSGLGPTGMQQPLQNVRNFPPQVPPMTNNLPATQNNQSLIKPPMNAFQQTVQQPPLTNNTYPPTYQSYPPSQPPQSLPPSVQNVQQPNVPQAPNSQSVYQPQPPPGFQYNTDQYNGQQGLARQMGGMSVTQNSFSKMWGHESVDLMQCRNVLPEQKLEPPTIKLNHQFAQSINCSPEIFRCTVSKIPETHSLLQKSRLPLGILIHPFKDLNHLPVIQCSSIVRCRACRTYINPFVYFIDLKRWKCNLCYRVNDLPEEFQYDPVTKSYGDPTRRPEIQSATIEYIAPSEYMLRPPQPAAYLFLLDVSAAAAESGYLQIVCQTLTEQIDSLPGDARTQLAFICFDSAVHFYFLGEGASRPREMTVIDIEDVFLPSPEDLLVNLVERRTAILELLAALPTRHGSPSPSATQSALGAALQAAYKLMAPTGGRITVFQTCLPNVGPGALTAREDPNNRSSKDVAHLNPATDFYKRLALDCSGVQVAVDLFLLNSQYADLSTISGISRFSGGSIYHQPLFKGNREKQANELQRTFTRYLTRKIGFEAVMRVRCTRGLAIHTFHGSFFVRSTDLLSLPNVSPDSGFGMQLAIEENLSDVQHVCFQAALLYTSSKGERRIRVHTLCLPVVSTLNDVIHSADQQCIIGLLSKMAVDRSQSSSLSDAREALLNAAVDALGAHKLASGISPGLMAPVSIRLLALYLHALLKNPAFRTGTSTRLDDRVFAMCNMKSLPLANLMRTVYPDLYPIHNLSDYTQLVASQDSENENEEIAVPCPPRLHLSAERINSTGAYLLDNEFTMYLYIGHKVDPNWLRDTFGIESNTFIGDNYHSIPILKTEQNTLLHAFIDDLNNERSHRATIHVIADNAPIRTLFTEKLLDDRVESALSYYEFLQHIKSQIK